MNARRCLLTILLLSTAAIWAQSSKPAGPKPTVVFVCEHGSAKSVMAAAEFRRMAKERGLDVNVLERGTNPDPEVPKAIRDGLKADGLAAGIAKPTKVSADDLRGATRVVSFGPDLTTWLPKGAAVADWSSTPSPSENYRAARDYIRQQIEALLQNLVQ